MNQPLACFGTDPEYKIYTTDNDVDTTCKSLWAEMTPQQNLDLNRQWHAYEDLVCEMRMIAAWGWQASADTVVANSAFDLSRTAVSIVVAQSGPMCSQKATVTYFLVELMTTFLRQIGVQYEVLASPR